MILIGTTYAFFTASTDNSHKQTASVTSGTMVLTFSDNDNGVSAVLHLGESVTKKFTIQNTGTLEAYAKINWVDLVNTYISSGLTYELSYSKNQNGTYIPVKTGTVPSSSSATTTELSSALIIPANTTYYYKLTITYNNLINVDQTADTSARMHSKFNMESIRYTTYYAFRYAGNADGFPTNITEWTQLTSNGDYMDPPRVFEWKDSEANIGICITLNLSITSEEPDCFIAGEGNLDIMTQLRHAFASSYCNDNSCTRGFYTCSLGRNNGVYCEYNDNNEIYYCYYDYWSQNDFGCGGPV